MVRGEWALTGASHTCIGAEVAHELGLRSTSFVESHGAGGWHQSPEVFARLSFRVPRAHVAATLALTAARWASLRVRRPGLHLSLTAPT